MSEQEKGVLRNPNEQELKELKQINAQKGVSVKQKKEEIKTENFFEPKAIKFTLPSKHLVVPGSEISVRRMTTVEENYFYSTIQSMRNMQLHEHNPTNINLSSRMFLETASRAIDNCIKDEDVSVYDLLLIDKISLFIFILGLTYGFEQEFELVCQKCKSRNKHKINLNKDIKVNYVEEDIEYPKKIETSSFEFPVALTIRYPTINEEPIWLDEKINLIERYLSLVVNAEGVLPNNEEITEEHYLQIVSNLNKTDKNKIQEFIDQFSEYGSDINVKKKVCKNKQCSMYNKIQEVTLPLETIFMQIF